tara:strand:+ start:7151 stop:8278 length:1128 start_codon:yes stop_codon:yes gene_type:complete
MKPINFFLKSNISIELGILKNLSSEIYNLNIKKPFFIYDKNIDDAEYFIAIKNTIKKNFGEDNLLPIDLKGEPTYDLLDKLNESLDLNLHDALISIGGGSVMDVGKALSLLATNDNKPIELRGFPKNLKQPIQHITIPSILGSGSEASFNAVFIDKKENRKMGINYINNFPVRVLVDPLLTMSAPKKVVTSSALDSLVHCIDSFGSKKSNLVTKEFSKVGFKNSWNALLNDRLNEPKERIGLAIGSIFGIYALMNSGDGPTNGFAYYFGVQNNIPHGIAGGMFLKHVMEYNCSKGFEGYDELFSYLGYNSKEQFFQKFDEIYSKNNIEKLDSYGYQLSDCKDLAKKVSDALQGSFSGNPIDFDEKSAFEVLKTQF